MADDADHAGDNTEKFEADAIKAVQAAAQRRTLIPIIQEMDGTRFGICHCCESPIKPGHLFCHTDEAEPDKSCSCEWDKLQAARKRNGK